MTEGGAARVVVCRVGGQRFVLPITAVREVVATPPVIRLPGAPPAIRGVANVNGTLVTSVSGRELLGSSESGGGEWLVVLTPWQGKVGLEVDEVEDVGERGGLPQLEIARLIQPLLADPE